MRGDGDLAGNLLLVGLFVVILAVGFAAAGVRRSGKPRRTVERQATVRRQARARAGAGMPPGHPETPGPPGRLEQAAHAELYGYVAGLLAGNQ